MFNELLKRDEEEGEKQSCKLGAESLFKLALEGKVGFWRLSGPDEMAKKILVLISLHPNLGSPEEGGSLHYMVSRSASGYLPSHLEEILELEIPAVEPSEVVDNPTKRALMEEGLASLRVPSVMITIGRTEKGVKTYDLFALPGISPQTALSEIKAVAGLAQAKIALNN